MQVLIFPKVVRKRSCSPLPDLKHLKVMIYTESIRNPELQEALRWCANSVETLEILSQNKPFNYYRWYMWTRL